MTSSGISEIKFIVKQPIIPNGPIIEWAVLIYKPNGDIFVVPASST